jgi:prevent-host-death family protein
MFGLEGRIQVPASEAKAQLTELVRSAEAGEDVVLTRRGEAVVRLVPVRRPQDPATRTQIIAALQAGVASLGLQPGDAARSQDFL